ncbi:hypothetical protein [Planktothrix mougeotii]|uniref:Uncharacterized protein n=1 Tax=Planktothrix mougeotii LEGE 06226 TaxID=1828728 RepID=A0ABR9UEH0_9CYAN|nr:hypothetical protein [Planktothrix mougeotii]MBE9144823.1 hypothetical protein [Planktothrix mougeotii LEGE 06226]
MSPFSLKRYGTFLSSELDRQDKSAECRVRSAECRVRSAECTEKIKTIILPSGTYQLNIRELPTLLYE